MPQPFISSMLPVPPSSTLFPYTTLFRSTDELLDHVPILIDGIAAYLENPADNVATDAPVIAKAMELGQMRHDQGFDAYQIFKEYEILGSVLYSFLAKVVDQIDVPCSRGELLHCGHRLFTSVVLI